MDKLELKAQITVDDAGTIAGTAWPFGSADRLGDTIIKGAFAPVARLPMLFAHDQAQAVGVWDSIAETDAGLVVKGRLLIEEVARAREIRALIREGAVTGLSIGFVTRKAQARPGSGRTISALDLHEISIVAVPAHPGARITHAKSISQGETMEQATAATPEQVALEVKAANDNLAKLTARLDKIEARANRPTPANDDGASPTEERKAFAGYLRLGNAAPELKALNVSNDPQGGYLAPAELSTEFVRDLVEYSPFRTIATVRNTGAPAIILPKRIGRTNARWKGEATATTGSAPSFGQHEIATKEIGTHVDISAQLLEDGAQAESEVRLALAEDFALKEGPAFVSGDGVLEPFGFLTVGGVGYTANGHATTLSADALITLMYALPATYRNRGSWVLNGTTLATIRKLKDGQNNYLWQPSYQAGQPETILGRPLVELADMPDIAENAFPIAFGDFGTAYRIYDRLELSILSNPYLLATEGLVRIHARRRTGGDVVQPAAIRKLKMATS